MTSRIRQRPLPLICRLRDLRIISRMSQREVCEIAGLHEKAVHQWESGLNIPTIGNFIAALNVLDYDLVIHPLQKTRIE